MNEPMTFRLGDALLDCDLLAASEDGGENSNQVVARLEDDGLTTLFTGDTAAESLDKISRQQATDLILVPHHGSKNSWNAAFYDTRQPSLALISAGRNNRYGHPHAETTDGLSALNIPTLCTADIGAVRIYAQDGALYYKTGP